MTKMSRQKHKYLENEKSFWVEIKAFFIIFKELSVAKNSFRPESTPLIIVTIFSDIIFSLRELRIF